MDYNSRTTSADPGYLVGQITGEIGNIPMLRQRLILILRKWNSQQFESSKNLRGRMS